MKKRFIACVLVLALGFAGCGSHEVKEIIATSVNTTTIAETTTTATTEPAPEPEITLPVIDGSTSTIPLHAYIKTKLLGGIYSEICDRTIHNKTFESFDRLLASVYSYAASRQVSARNVALLSVDGILPSRETFTDGSYPRNH
jgi:hypothetical protein